MYVHDMELSCGGRDGGWIRITNIKMGAAVLMDGNKYCLRQKHAEPTDSNTAKYHSAFLVAANFPISISVVKWLGIKKALQMDTDSQWRSQAFIIDWAI